VQQATKQRIVGSVLLLALALIFLPIIFDGQGSYESQLASRIPEAPVFTPMERPVAERPRVIAEQPAVSPPDDKAASAADDTASQSPRGEQSAQQPETVAVVESAPDFVRQAPGLDDAGLPEGWAVRLGTFAEQANADELLSRLRDAGYKAYTRAVDSQQGALTAVFVGPWLDRARSNEYLEELQDRFRLSGMLVRYEIEEL
jgi:DedD protein